MASRAKGTPHYSVHYQDRGCDVSESCLTCPLSQCKHDDPGAYIEHQRRLRDQRISKAVAVEGLTVDEAAQRFCVTVRTIFRAIQRVKEAGA